MKKTTFLVLLIALTVASCSKYEDGPSIAVRSRANRLTNSWTYSQVYQNGLTVLYGLQSADQNYSQSSIGFAEDGRFSYFDVRQDSSSVRGDGFWEFAEKDEKIILTYDPPSTLIRTLVIKRLERSYLWLEEEKEGNNTLEFQLVPND